MNRPAGCLFPDSQRLFAAEGRIGGEGTFELGLGSSVDQPADTESFFWENGVPVEFYLNYFPDTGEILFFALTPCGTNGMGAVADCLILVSWQVDPAPITDIFVRAASVSAEASVSVTDLTLNGVAIDPSATATSPPDGGLVVDIVRHRCATGADEIRLKGVVTLRWPHEQPIESELSLRIEAGTARPDCNGNNRWDKRDILLGSSLDLDRNGVPDECQSSGPSEDCNRNTVPDECDITDRTSRDCNHNGIPDECESPDDDCGHAPES